MQRTLKIYRWRPPKSRYGNFGDEITIPLLATLFGIEAIPSPMRSAELLGAGSILDVWSRASWKRRLRNHLPIDWRSPDLHVWGTGLIIPGQPSWPQRLHIHAVRGSLTAELMNVRVALGDPGILANVLIDSRPPKSFAVGLVPHHTEVDFLKERLQPLPTHWTVISPEAPVQRVLKEIAACDLILSSSLHGLITADSFGIPCVWMRTQWPLYGNSDFKFLDHESARRAPFNKSISYDDVIGKSATQLSDLATSPGRGLEEWQHELLDAFPFR